jgi:class 3 adenylate cyclase/tetratricopeptide (TPR) repeat protein
LTQSPSARRHSLASYLPRMLVERLGDALPLSSPEARQTQGAILLSDIRGFTALVERAAAGGKAGLEELTWLLNGYVADVVAAVESYGGDVVSIAGDAFLCFWPAATDEDLTHAVLRAAHAGAAIQRSLNGGRAERLATRIGIGVGDLIVAYCGGVDGRWEVTLSGGALRDVATMEKAALAGSVLLSADAWRAMRGECVGRPGPNGGMELVSAPNAGAFTSTATRRGIATDEALRPFVPPSVLDRVVAGDAEWLAESRAVTVLLAEVSGMHDAGADELARVQAAVHGCQDIVRRYDGTMRVDVDDKGLLFLVVLGLPPRAHEDDAARAVLAAAELEAVLDRANGGTRRSGIGIATGRALCGSFGSDVRRDYIVRGDVINLAARLMHAGNRATLCDAPTVHASRGRVGFEALTPVTVRGRAEPIAVYRPVGRTAVSGRAQHDVVGRTHELTVLNAQIETARGGGHAGLAILEGEAGLGKSRLVTEVSRRAGEHGLRVFTAAADAIEQSTPYYAWRPVFSALFEIALDDDSQTIRERITRRMARLPALDRLLPLLGGVLSAQIPDTPLTAEMTGEVRADNTRLLLREILQDAARESPTLLVLEDAHWLDSASWNLLLDVVQSVQPLCTLVASRPFSEPAPREWRRLTDAAGERRLRLEALSPSETAALVRQRLGVREIPEALARFVEERVSGHPFFCEELLRAMLDAGVVRVADGACTVGDLSRLDLPTTVEGVIVSRLDRLTPSQQLCLKVASVIGRVFRERMVRETHPVDTQRPLVSENLGALATADLTALESPEPELAYLFKHVITRDVAYESMPFAQRQPLHAAIAGWYERTHGTDLAPHYALLAYHWARAANPPKTVHYLDLAGEQALFAGAFREAVGFFTQAIALADAGEVEVEPLRRALWEKNLGRSQYYLGALHVSREHNERALVALHRPVPSGNAALVGRTLAEIGRQIGHRFFPRRYLGRRSADKLALNEAVETYKNLGQAYYLEAEPPLKLLYLTVTGLNAGEEAGPSGALARVMMNSSILAYLVGLPKQCEWYAERAIAMAEREGLSASAYVWHIRALSLAQRAAWSDAKAANAHAQSLTRELGDFGLEAEGWTTRTTIALCEGDFAFAPTGWKRQRELAERNGNGQLKCWSLIDETDTWLGCGDTQRASEALAGALAIELSSTDIGTRLDRARSTAVTRQREDRVEEALRAADEVFDALMRQPPTGYQWADDFAAVVEVYLELLTARSDLQSRVEKGCKALTRFSRIYRNVRPRASLLLGMLRQHQGRHADAARAFASAEQIAADMSMPFELARAQQERSRVFAGDERQRLAAQAAAVFEKLGATYYLGRS